MSARPRGDGSFAISPSDPVYNRRENAVIHTRGRRMRSRTIGTLGRVLWELPSLRQAVPASADLDMVLRPRSTTVTVASGSDPRRWLQDLSERIGSGSDGRIDLRWIRGWLDMEVRAHSTDLGEESPMDEFGAGRGDAAKSSIVPCSPRHSGYVWVCNYDRPNTTSGDAVEEERDATSRRPWNSRTRQRRTVADLQKPLSAARVPGPYATGRAFVRRPDRQLYARTYWDGRWPRAGRCYNVFLKDTLAAGELAILDAGVMAENLCARRPNASGFWTR